MSYDKEQRIINSVVGSTKQERNAPVVNKDTEGFVLPNKSGDHIRSIKRDVPVNDYDLVNKKYVDDSIPSFTLPLSHTDATEITDVGTKTHAQLDAHFTDANAHTWANINKTTSNIADITTRSHTSLTDIGTKTHAQLDAHFTDANAHTWANINKTTSNIADITTRSHTSLTDIGTNTHTQIDNHISDSSDPHGSTLTQTTLNCTNLQIGGVAVTSSANELNYVDGVTSNIQTQINQANPVGRIVMYGGSSAPTGWFLCNGAAVSRTTYAALFAVIGTTFGTGDGSTTFNLPDLRGIFVRGAGTSGKLSNANGTAFSGTLGTYQNDKFQGHYHTTYFSSDSGSNSYPVGGTTRDSLNIVTDAPAARGIVADGTNGNPRIGAETNPANLGLNFIIKY